MQTPLIDRLNTEANRREGSAPAYGDRAGPNGRRLWGGNALIGTIYTLSAADTQRVGNCWAKGRLKEGDSIMCLRKRGDAFYDYLLLETVDYVNRPGLKLSPIAEFCGYQMGSPVCHLTDSEFVTLTEGNEITTDFKWGVDPSNQGIEA